ncbi:hypothetical protein BC941DRAFT_387572 [Chlamydoabsidia padenii]|nr:hypothetical protein BC941DRAFT_387572 [Chlamydoabsidia padenii]
MDPEYDPSHKTSSITSTTSTTSWDTVPSMTASSICDMDSPSLHDQTTFEDYSFAGDRVGLSIPFENVSQIGDQKTFDRFFDHYFFTNDKPTPPPPPQHQAPRDTRLLTEDEKRANHIASEQKRRNAIRTGFKDMTDIIPTLKNINHSKSTILFKAVEYIRHLDKRNRGLRDKLRALQVRLAIQGRHQKSRSLPPEAVAALLAHKNQQRQLERLQEQLKYQQELLIKHNISTAEPLLYPSISIPIDAQINRTWPSFSIPADDDFGPHS